MQLARGRARHNGTRRARAPLAFKAAMRLVARMRYAAAFTVGAFAVLVPFERDARA